MFEFGKVSKAEADRAGLRHATLINETLQRWEAVLDARRTAIETEFAERVARLSPAAGRTIERMAQDEAAAALRDWHQSHQRSVADFSRNMLSAETRRAITALDLRAHVDGHMTRIWADVSERLDAGLGAAARAVGVRGR